jgi:hypothetical protein
MIVTNFWGVFTVLLLSHSVAVLFACVAGYEYALDQQTDKDVPWKFVDGIR